MMEEESFLMISEKHITGKHTIFKKSFISNVEFNVYYVNPFFSVSAVIYFLSGSLKPEPSRVSFQNRVFSTIELSRFLLL